MPSDDILRRIKMSAQAEPKSVGGRGKRSKLFRWLFARADEFQALLDEHQPSWTTIANAFDGTDVSDGSGKKPSPERVRKAWLEVRQAKGLALAKKRPPPPLPIRSPEEVRASEIQAETRPSFGTARLRGHDPAQTPVPIPIATPEKPPRADPDEVIARFVGKPPKGG